MTEWFVNTTPFVDNNTTVVHDKIKEGIICWVRILHLLSNYELLMNGIEQKSEANNYTGNK